MNLTDYNWGTESLSPGQVECLVTLGVSEDESARLTKREAAILISRLIFDLEEAPRRSPVSTR